MVAANPERFHLHYPPDDPVAPFLGMILGTVGVFIFYSAANQVMIQRVLAARLPWDGTMEIIFAGFINLIPGCDGVSRVDRLSLDIRVRRGAAAGKCGHRISVSLGACGCGLASTRVSLPWCTGSSGRR